MPLHWHRILSSTRNLSANSFYNHLSTASAMLAVSSRNQHAEEIVEDSEPERAEIRRTQRKPKSNILSTEPKQQGRKPACASVFEKARCNNSVIEISDSDSEPSKPYKRHIEPKASSPPISIASSSRLSNTSGAGVSLAAILTNSEKTADMAQPKTINLKHLAYTDSAVTKKSSSPREAPSSVLQTTSRGAVVPPPVKKQKLAGLDLSSSDLAKLFRCVCCEIPWTTRKTAIQKMTHIRSCAKKHYFDEETIRTLIQTEIANHISQTKPHEKSKLKQVSSEEGTPRNNTLLEDMVVDAAPRKKVKRQKAETMLATVSLTRDTILARARVILSAPTPDLFNQKGPIPNFDDIDLEMPPPTFPFARSTLAERQGTTSRTLFSDITCSPQRTDVMDASSSNQVWEVGEDVPTDVTPHEIQASLPVKSSRGGDISESLTSTLRLDKMIIGPDDNAIPRLAAAPIDLCETDTNLYHVSIVREGKLKLKARPSSLSSSLEEAFAVDITPAAKRSRKGTRARTQKKTPPKEVRKFDEEWEKHMKKQILQDTNLHHRVLRYEPVHFNVFLELAQLYAPPSSKLKSHLRIFLDNQAIHFYEGLAWKR